MIGSLPAKKATSLTTICFLIAGSERKFSLGIQGLPSDFWTLCSDPHRDLTLSAARLPSVLLVLDFPEFCSSAIVAFVLDLERYWRLRPTPACISVTSSLWFTTRLLGPAAVGAC